jgi:hypothetical protein
MTDQLLQPLRHPRDWAFCQVYPEKSTGEYAAA